MYFSYTPKQKTAIFAAVDHVLTPCSVFSLLRCAAAFSFPVSLPGILDSQWSFLIGSEPAYTRSVPFCTSTTQGLRWYAPHHLE